VINDGVMISLIGVGGSLLTAYITIRLRQRKPRGQYIDLAFESYENIMKRQDEELQRAYADQDKLRIENKRLSDENALLRNRSNI
jgi:hypothetical protein